MADWFASKRRGFGSGMPITWHGWAVLAAYAATITGAFLLFGETNPAAYAVLVIATGLLLVVTSKTTKGGWRWRSDGDS